MKRIYLVVLSLISILLVSACSSINSYQKSLYDDKDRLALDGDSYTFEERIGGEQEDALDVTFRGFYGKQTVKKIQSDSQRTVELEIMIKLNRGSFKVCLIDANKDVTIIAEGQTNEEFVITLPEGTNTIVIVGKNASGEVNIRFNK